MSITEIAVQKPHLRDVLREHTHDIHQLLHRHSSFVALFKQQILLSEYQHLIQFLHGFYAPLDAAIKSLLPFAGAGLATYDYVSRSDLLEKDLRAFGYDDVAIDANARCHEISNIVSPTTIGGVLYVVEGAALGGAAIDRAVARILPHADIGGRHYWSWCRADNQRCWTNFRTYLDHVEASDATTDGHIKGANDTFEAFANWMAPLHRAKDADQKGAA